MSWEGAELLPSRGSRAGPLISGLPSGSPRLTELALVPIKGFCWPRQRSLGSARSWEKSALLTDGKILLSPLAN